MKIVTDTGAIIAGKVTQDTRIVKGNKERAEFSVVVGESDFVKCVVWVDVDIANGIKKGDRILVAGKMNYYKAQNGKEYQNLMVDYFHVMPLEENPATGNSFKSDAKNKPELTPIDDPDLPF